jgi:nucleoside 2-deoxyribosyltransferase
VNVYLAARYSRRLELCGYADELRGYGLTVTSRWLEGNHQAENDQLHRGAEAERFAAEDLEDLRDACVLVAFSEVPRTTSSRGGRHVEFGYAMALDIPILVVGPREHVFCCLVDQVDEWHQAMPWIAEQIPLDSMLPSRAENGHPESGS